MVGVREIARELGAGAGVALAAGLQLALAVEPARRVGDRHDVVVPVAVVARGHLRTPERQRLAVERLAVVLDAVFVALAAAVAAGELERHLVGLENLVRGVAVGADGRFGLARGRQLPVQALLVDVQDSHVAVATGLGDVRPVHR